MRWTSRPNRHRRSRAPRTSNSDTRWLKVHRHATEENHHRVYGRFCPTARSTTACRKLHHQAEHGGEHAVPKRFCSSGDFDEVAHQQRQHWHRDADAQHVQAANTTASTKLKPRRRDFSFFRRVLRRGCSHVICQNCSPILGCDYRVLPGQGEGKRQFSGKCSGHPFAAPPLGQSSPDKYRGGHCWAGRDRKV